jgi:hypothetical protein
LKPLINVERLCELEAHYDNLLRKARPRPNQYCPFFKNGKRMILDPKMVEQDPYSLERCWCKKKKGHKFTSQFIK